MEADEEAVDFPDIMDFSLETEAEEWHFFNSNNPEDREFLQAAALFSQALHASAYSSSSSFVMSSPSSVSFSSTSPEDEPLFSLGSENESSSPPIPMTLDESTELVFNTDTTFEEVAQLTEEFVLHSHPSNPQLQLEARDFLHVPATPEPSAEAVFALALKYHIEARQLSQLQPIWDSSVFGQRHPWDSTAAPQWFYPHLHYFQGICKLLPVEETVGWLTVREVDYAPWTDTEKLQLVAATLERTTVQDAITLWHRLGWQPFLGLWVLAQAKSTLLVPRPAVVAVFQAMVLGISDETSTELALTLLPDALNNPNLVIGDVFLEMAGFTVADAMPWLLKHPNVSHAVLTFLSTHERLTLNPGQLNRLPKDTPPELIKDLQHYVRKTVRAPLGLLLRMRASIGKLGHWIDTQVRRMRQGASLPSPPTRTQHFHHPEHDLRATFLPHVMLLDLEEDEATQPSIFHLLPRSACVLIPDHHLHNWQSAKGVTTPRQYVFQVLEQALCRSQGVADFAIVQGAHAAAFRVTDVRYGWEDFSLRRLEAWAASSSSERKVVDFFPEAGEAREHRYWSTPLARFYQALGVGSSDISPLTQAVLAVGFRLNNDLCSLSDTLTASTHNRSFFYNESLEENGGPSVQLKGIFIAETWKSQRHIRLKHHLIASGNRDPAQPMVVHLDSIQIQPGSTPDAGDRSVQEYVFYVLQLLVDLGRVWARPIQLRGQAVAQCQPIVAEWSKYARRNTQPWPHWSANLNWFPVPRARSVLRQEAVVVPEYETMHTETNELALLPGANGRADPRGKDRPVPPSRYEEKLDF